MTNERAVEILNLDLDILGQYGCETAEAYKMAIQALEAQPNRCDSCKHSEDEEQDGSNCYECGKGMADNFEAQPTDKGEISDGYHTFNQLYHQRAILFATIVNQNKDKAWKSFKHSDGKYCFDSDGEWFIVGVDTPQGSYTYHYSKEYWDMFDCQELECGKEWDGHTEEDVTRLLSLEQQPCEDCISRQKALDCFEQTNTRQGAKYAIETLPSVTPRINLALTSQDCISREEMLKYQQYLHGKMSNEENHKLWNFIKGLPSVTPQYTDEEIDKAQAVEQAYVDKMVELAVEETKRPKGKWIKIQSGNEDFPESIVCSRCKNENSYLDFDEHSEPIGKVFVTSKYCPNCGAEMSGGEEDET